MSARTAEKTRWKNTRANFVADPVAAARGLDPRDIDSARTLHDHITAYHDDPDADVPDGWDASAAKARGELEQLHPELRNRPFGEGREDDLAPHERRFRRSGHAKTRYGRNRPPKGPQNPRTERRGGQSRGSGRRAGTRSPRRGPAQRAWTDTGVPAAVGGWRDLGLQVVGFGLLATLGYDLLTGRGPKAVQAAAGGVGTFVRAIVAPVDPLRARAATVQTTTALAATATSPSGIPLDWTPRLANYPDNHRTPPHRAPLFTNPLATPTIGGTP